MAEVVLDFWHFYIFLWGYSIINVHSIRESSWLHSPFKNFKIRACGMYAHWILIIYAPPCRTYFFPHQVHVVKGWLLWVLNLNILKFWNMTHVWNYALSWVYKKIIINWYWCPKLYICNMLNYMLIIVFNTNANVHVLST